MPFRIFAALAVLMLTAACASSSRLLSSWQDMDYRGGPFRRVLVMGFGEDGAGRRLFEDEFVRSLKAHGVTAIPSYAFASGVHETDLQRVREMVARSRADCVLTTRLVGVDKRTVMTPGQVVVAPTIVHRRGFYGFYSSVLLQSPPTMHQYEVAKLETSLWQLIGDRMVWSGVSETADAEAARRGSPALADGIVKALRERGLI